MYCLLSLTAYKYAPNLESLLTQQYVWVMCTLWSDNTCVFTRFYSIKNANTQLIWSSDMILILPRHCLLYDPDSSPSLSYIWFWFFPVTVLYMILILPRHCLIYDPDSSLSVLYMILILPHHCLIYDPDSSLSVSYIWSRFFPVMHCLIYDYFDMIWRQTRKNVTE
jgi:hypothetical protein